MLRVVCVKRLRQIRNHSCLCVNLSFLTFKKHKFVAKLLYHQSATLNSAAWSAYARLLRV